MLASLMLAASQPAAAFAQPAAHDDAATKVAAVTRPMSVPQETDGYVGTRTPQDHKDFKQLQGPFTTPEQVTQACLSCHTQAARQVMSNIHWTWKAWDPKTKRIVGKNEVYNNFCVSPISNEQFCTVCHIGYGSTDPNTFIPFSQRAEDRVDCLACHDQTKTYRKIPFIGGNPAMEKIAVRPGCNEVYGTDKPYVLPEDLPQIAKSVGPPTRYTCGLCHFYGGGGDGVKHGDLDSSLDEPSHDLDVHMDAKGLNFPCQQCHQSGDHRISGRHYTIDAVPVSDAFLRGAPHNGNAVTCQSCHSETPHHRNDDITALVAGTLNMHTRDIACQTCHIPEFARGSLPTKLDWNYATAGKLAPNGSPLVMVDKRGWNTYWGVKGSFAWGVNVVPDYRWFNGTEDWLHIGDKARPDKNGVVAINQIEGSATDGKSRIWPFKISRNNQPYDMKTGTLAVFHSFGFDDDAFTMAYDWKKAITVGMKAANLPFSGEIGFEKTAMYWPITHMVAPKSKALACRDCHANNGRLQNIDGVYIPGRATDHQPWIERIGLLMAALACVAVFLHGTIRVAMWLRRKF
ncbi:tetrathionate reductase family octaheme c-type cytochrome [Rhodopila globiformis]|uniref:tetrathionate reductase family octaheme c-type cytochrome n=1 Tax=Rhodopila globiformis TaxID=1071 RepID=UPI001958D915|nr:tetrathionate reductase family octaheme c-type cytochrome [Rhodopila globiformis]